MALALISFGLLGSEPPAVSQTAAPEAAATQALRPTLSRIAEVTAGLNVSRWKAPGEVRSVTQRDVDSIQRDLSSTLPPLLDQANAAPASVAASFAVYRNIDALYDVLLRVAETATLAGSPGDAGGLQSALTDLEMGRRDLGDRILALASTHEQELVSLRAAAAQSAAAAAQTPPPPVKTVVDDGPASSAKSAAPAAKRKKKPASPPVPVPAAANPPQ